MCNGATQSVTTGSSNINLVATHPRPHSEYHYRKDVIGLDAARASCLHSKPVPAQIMAPALQNPTSSWELVSGQYYRKLSLFTPSWSGDEDFNLDDYIVAGAPFGGALGEFESHTTCWCPKCAAVV